MALTEQAAIEKLFELGHFANPAKLDTFNVERSDLPKLGFNDPVVKQAIASYQAFMGADGDRLSNEHHARPMIHDGEVGPATLALFEVQRCAVPDYRREPLPAVGTGNWPRCHGIGNFHAAKVYINRRGMPSFLAPVWDQVWENTVRAYEDIGLRFVETDDPNSHNTSINFVGSSSGWIGLAIVGRGQGCGSKIWSRYLATYRGGSTAASITQQWTSLVKHELGHNCGLEHSRGGVMNPSIVNGLPTSWKGDPSEPQLKRWFGGEPIPGDEPEPPQPPPGDESHLGIAMSVVVPEDLKPGKYDFIAVPRPVV